MPNFGFNQVMPFLGGQQSWMQKGNSIPQMPFIQQQNYGPYLQQPPQDCFGNGHKCQENKQDNLFQSILKNGLGEVAKNFIGNLIGGEGIMGSFAGGAADGIVKNLVDKFFGGKDDSGDKPNNQGFMQKLPFMNDQQGFMQNLPFMNGQQGFMQNLPFMNGQQGFMQNIPFFGGHK